MTSLLDSLRKLVVGAAFALLLPTSNASDLDFSTPVSSINNVLANEELAIAFSVAPPFVMIDSDFSHPIGIDVDITNELQKRTGFKVQNNRFRIMNFTQMIDLANNGEFDLIGGGLTLNEERSHKFTLIGPIVNSSSVVVVKNDHENISSLKDLNGHTMAAELGTTSEDIIPHNSEIDINMHNRASLFMCFYSVASGEADSVIADAPIAYDYINNWKGSNLKLAFAIPDTLSNLGLLATKDPKVAQALNQAFKEMCQDGTVEKIVDKYVGTQDSSGQNYFSLSDNARYHQNSAP